MQRRALGARCPLKLPGLIERNVASEFAPPTLNWLRCRTLLRYFGITSRASLLATTSRVSLRFFPASIIASREP